MAHQAAMALCNAVALYRHAGLSRAATKVVRYGNMALRAYSRGGSRGGFVPTCYLILKILVVLPGVKAATHLRA